MNSLYYFFRVLYHYKQKSLINLPFGKGWTFSLLLLLPTLLTAQPLQWTWAKNGGGDFSINPSTSSLLSHDYERIVGTVSDSNNNSYFIAQIGTSGEEIDGQPFTTYSRDVSGGADGLLFSVDCSGNLRWQKVIGGDNKDYITGIGIDQNDNIYVSGFNIPPTGNTSIATHFDNDFINPARPNNGSDGPWAKKIYIAKYNDLGTLLWIRQPQRDLSTLTEVLNISEIIVEPNGTSHVLCSFPNGIHANGLINVSNANGTTGDWYILKYDTNGTLLSVVDVPDIDGGAIVTSLYNVKFEYDSILQQYYIAAYKTEGAATQDIFFNGTLINNSMFLAALDNSGNILWKLDDSGTNMGISGGLIRNIKVDSNSDIYVCGAYGNSGAATTAANFAGFSFGQNHPANDFSGVRNYILKLNSSGNLVWGSDPNFEQVSNLSNFDIAIDGNDIYVAGNLNPNTWDGINYTYGNGNTRNAPVVLRLNKTTGQLQEIIDAGMDTGDTQAAMAIDVDNFGNVIVGGYLTGSLFNNIPNVSPVVKDSGASDFWFARLAKTDCNGVPLSIEEVAQDGFSIYPNPASSFIQVQTIGNTILTGYHIYSMTGQIIQKGASSETTISIENLKSGVYFIELTGSENTRNMIKLIKK
jgi:hypothetical protein